MQKAFYVRECYLQYYRTILRLLYTGYPTRDMKVVTVTGTPGEAMLRGLQLLWGADCACISQELASLFSAHRYSLEFPDATVITASFVVQGDNSKMKAVTVWKFCKVVGRAELLDSAMVDLMLEAERTATSQVIHLYDGPPTMVPLNDQLVCFTSHGFVKIGRVNIDQGCLCRCGVSKSLMMKYLPSRENFVVNAAIRLGKIKVL